MCGIAGIVNLQAGPPNRGVVQGMMDVMHHRGPDGEGIYRDPQATLGHVRLSIIDVEGSQQPLANEDETVWVITMALDNGRPLLVMPRRRKYQEVVNDHQAVLADKFEALGHLLVAQDETQLRAKVEELRSFAPRPRQAEPEVVARRIGRFWKVLEGTGDVP